MIRNILELDSLYSYGFVQKPGSIALWAIVCTETVVSLLTTTTRNNDTRSAVESGY